MKILVDSQIPLLHELFSCLGEVNTYSGRVIEPEQLQDVEVLIVRSTMMVDESLLQHSSVKFVGTCTIGTDHLDTDYLDAKGITWANAAGCNANSVAQYVLSAMAELAPQWLTANVGIVACGNIGRRVYRRLRALGVNCFCYDPFLSSEACSHLTSLEQVLQADIVISHAPLTTTGKYPTQHLLSHTQLEQLQDGCLLISAGRGAVVDNAALLAKLKPHKNISVALDVWEHEPDINLELLALVDIATPHIAGHSVEGKQNGTVMVYRALCEFLQVSAIDVDTILDTEKQALRINANKLAGTPAEQFNQLLLAAYPIMQDDQRLREYLHQPVAAKLSMAEYFDTLRKHYPARREYPHFIFPTVAQQAPIKDWLLALYD